MGSTLILAGLVLLAILEALAGSLLLRRERQRRRQAETDAAESRALMVEVQKLARIGNWEFDLIHDQIRWSEETFHIFGLPPGSQEPEFADVLLAIDPEDRPVFDAAIERAISGRQPYSIDLRIRTPEGTQKFIHAQGSAVHDGSGKALRLIGTLLDITERKREENRLATAASHDSLTGLANRGYFSNELEYTIRVSRESATPLSVCLCDVDRFKQVNDTHGHAAGDEVIQAFARCLSEGVRHGDLAARWGGDEFCILFPATSAASAGISVDRIRQKLASLRFSASDGGAFGVTGSFGIAELAAGMNSADLMEAADRSLYAAKQRGRNCLMVSQGSHDAGTPAPGVEARC